MNPHHDDRLTGLSEEAAYWFVRLKDNDLDAAERREYVAWLKQAPAHVAEMLRVTATFGALRGAGLKHLVSLEDGLPNVVEWAGAQTGERQRAPRVSRRRYWLAAAALVVVMFGGVLAVSLSGFNSDIATGASEWRRLTLQDGSVVRVGPYTRLQVSFQRERRAIELLQGEATFQVSKDPVRPFVVNAGLAQVRAVGTAFGVERRSAQVTVTVSEGAVAVLQAQSPDPGAEGVPAAGESAVSAADNDRAVPVSAGEQVIVSRTHTRTHTAPVRRVDVARALAWAEGRLIFDNETLTQAVAEFNRRNRLQIEVPDDTLGAWPVRGVFDAADAESFVSFLVAAGDIEASRAGKNRWVLKKRGDGFGR